jgi:hypothetical protein
MAVLPECPRRGLASPVSASHQVIMVAARWYLRFGLSYRDVEKLLAERGITVDHVTVSCNAASRAVMPLCGR